MNRLFYCLKAVVTAVTDTLQMYWQFPNTINYRFPPPPTKFPASIFRPIDPI
jgi:hypothetical protein